MRSTHKSTMNFETSSSCSRNNSPMVEEIQTASKMFSPIVTSYETFTGNNTSGNVEMQSSNPVGNTRIAGYTTSIGFPASYIPQSNSDTGMPSQTPQVVVASSSSGPSFVFPSGDPGGTSGAWSSGAPPPSMSPMEKSSCQFSYSFSPHHLHHPGSNYFSTSGHHRSAAGMAEHHSHHHGILRAKLSGHRLPERSSDFPGACSLQRMPVLSVCGERGKLQSTK